MERLTPTGYQLISTYICFLILAGGFIQIVTFLVLIRSTDLKTKSLTPYLINVVAANMVMIVGSFPSTLASSIANEWAFTDDLVCRIVGFLGGIAAISMIATMTCITVKIYNTLVSRGLKKRLKGDQNLTQYKIISLVWLYSILGMLPPLAGWTRTIKEAADMSCAPNWNAESTPDLVYILLLTFISYVIPVSIASVYHWKINKAINEHLKTVSRFSSAQRQLEGFRSISKMAGLAIVAFTITWLPYCVYALISAFGGSHLIDTKTGLIACLVAKSSILYNPFIYALVNPRFRANVMDFLKIKHLRSSSVNFLARATLSFSGNTENSSRPNQPRIIFRNHPQLRPRGGLENNHSAENEYSFPSYFTKGTENAAASREPRILVVRPVVDKDSFFTRESDVMSM
uniref:Opsin n=1 Tax=Exaiptasia diaphana TaxID=2652724 RepID=A0A346FU03_EXADI|nr:opsin [Exaiptasia diaphana]